MALNERGHEILDDTPVAIPMRFTRPPTQLDEMRRLLRLASQEASDHGMETFEEADDFDIGDDYDPQSPWELSVDQELGNPFLKAEESPPANPATGAAGAPSDSGGNPPSGASEATTTRPSDGNTSA